MNIAGIIISFRKGDGRKKEMEEKKVKSFFIPNRFLFQSMLMTYL
jgi:hypothetical protein